MLLFLLAAGIGLSMLDLGRLMPMSKASAGREQRQLYVDTPPRTVTLVATGSAGETAIARDASGQFHLDIAVNGQPLPFLVDTGADKVALTIEAARVAGLYVDPTGFEEVAVGASGPVKGQRVSLSRVEIGGQTLDNVDALVLEGLGTNLLGQSALARLGGVELRGDTMVLR